MSSIDSGGENNTSAIFEFFKSLFYFLKYNFNYFFIKKYKEMINEEYSD